MSLQIGRESRTRDRLGFHTLIRRGNHHHKALKLVTESQELSTPQASHPGAHGESSAEANACSIDTSTISEGPLKSLGHCRTCRVAIGALTAFLILLYLSVGILHTTLLLSFLFAL